MSRNYNTSGYGQKFDEKTIQAVWLKGKATIYSSFRKDVCGASMQWDRYGQAGQFGWEIDHILPVALGGTDYLSNLQPLMWENNRHKSDNYPRWTCRVG